jgi:hypothetical protein
MRDWKKYRPASDTPRVGTQPLVKKRRSDVEDPSADGEPEFEIAIDVNEDQLTLMFAEAVKYDQRPHTGPLDASVDHQEAWSAEASRSGESFAETFGPWSDESRLEGSTYYRRVTRLG